MNNDLLISTNLPGGGPSWTLTSRITPMLDAAQEMFGGMQKEEIFIGITFHRTVPYIQFIDPCYMMISINPDLTNTLDEALFQLSQEIVHLLTPIRNVRANVLEEGLATLFSRKIMSEHQFLAYWERSIRPPSNYYNAYQLAVRLLEIDERIILRIREQYPEAKMSQFTFDQFENVMGAAFHTELITDLLQPF